MQFFADLILTIKEQFSYTTFGVSMDFENFCNSYDNQQNGQFDRQSESKAKNDFVNKNQNKTKIENQTAGINGINEDEIKKKIEKYKNYDNQQLLTELLTEANKQKKSGNLTDQKLTEMIESMSPYLDDSQKQRLNEIAKLLR